MWYEDLRPFGVTETDIFDFVEGICAGKTIRGATKSWPAEDFPFSLLFRALYRVGFVQDPELREDVVHGEVHLVLVDAGPHDRAAFGDGLNDEPEVLKALVHVPIRAFPQQVRVFSKGLALSWVMAVPEITFCL